MMQDMSSHHIDQMRQNLLFHQIALACAMQIDQLSLMDQRFLF